MVRLKLNLLVLAVALQTVDSFVVDRVVPILHGWHYDDLIRDSIASKYRRPRRNLPSCFDRRRLRGIPTSRPRRRRDPPPRKTSAA